jgi:hypothetical protein
MMSDLENRLNANSRTPSKVDSHASCLGIFALLRAQLTRPIDCENGIHLSWLEQEGLDEVSELLQRYLEQCKP